MKPIECLDFWIGIKDYNTGEERCVIVPLTKKQMRMLTLSDSEYFESRQLGFTVTHKTGKGTPFYTKKIHTKYGEYFHEFYEKNKLIHVKTKPKKPLKFKFKGIK